MGRSRSFIGCLRARGTGPNAGPVPDLREHGTGREGVGVTEGVRAAGWYPDPWGTDGERYFDGAAWAPRVAPGRRRGRGVRSRTRWPPAATARAGRRRRPTLGDPPVDRAARPAVGRRAAARRPPAWHRDPWGLAAMRWWDGAQWTGYVSGPPPARVAPPDLAGERGAGALAAAGAARRAASRRRSRSSRRSTRRSGSSTTGSAITAPGRRRASRRCRRRPRARSVSSAGIVGFAIAILFLLWFYRAASTGWSSGMPGAARPDDRDVVVHHPDPQPVVAVPGGARHGAGRRSRTAA